MFRLENILMVFTSVMRYVFPVVAVIVVAVCVVSLFRNRPRIHKMAQLTDKNNGSVIDINHWETSIGKSRANDIVLPVPAVPSKLRFHLQMSDSEPHRSGKQLHVLGFLQPKEDNTPELP